MLANALRGHMAEFGLITAQGLHNVKGLIAIVRDDKDECIPGMARQVLRVIAEQIGELETRIAAIEAQIMAWHKSNPMSSTWRLSPASGRSLLPPLRRPSPSRVSFAVVGSLPPGWGSCRGRTPPAVKRASAGSANEATAISGVCWSTGHTL
jgi:hypothetical protein